VSPPSGNSLQLKTAGSTVLLRLVRRCAPLRSSKIGSIDTVSPQFGVPIEHEARKVTQSDFYNFTHILASDKSNLEKLLRKKPSDSTTEVKLWGSYVDGKPIADPYYGGIVS